MCDHQRTFGQRTRREPLLVHLEAAAQNFAKEAELPNADAEKMLVICAVWPRCLLLLLRLLGVFAARLCVDFLHMVAERVYIPQAYVDGIPIILGIEDKRA